MTGQVMWTRPAGDTGPPLSRLLYDTPLAGQRTGPLVDLTGRSVLGIVRRWSDRAIVQSAAATIVGLPANGAVQLPLTTMISTSPGLHSVEWRTTGTDQRTYPDPLSPDWLLIAAPAAGGTATPADPGAPVFIADTATSGPARNGQIVFAGAGATVSMPAAVSWFQLGQNPTGTPWATGTTPTITQAGSTIDPGVAAALLASGGNLVVITRIGTVITAATTGRATIWAYNGSSYAPDPDARLIERATGEPAPTGVVANDIVLTQNP